MGMFDQQQGGGLNQLMLLKQLGAMNANRGVSASGIASLKTAKGKEDSADVTAINTFETDLSAATNPFEIKAARDKLVAYQATTGRSLPGYSDMELASKVGGQVGAVDRKTIERGIAKVIGNTTAANVGKIMMANDGRQSADDGVDKAKVKKSIMGKLIDPEVFASSAEKFAGVTADEYFAETTSRIGRAWDEAVESAPAHIKEGMGFEDHQKLLFDKHGRTTLTNKFYDMAAGPGGMAAFSQAGGEQWVDQATNLLRTKFPKSHAEIDQINKDLKEQLQKAELGIADERTQTALMFRNLDRQIEGWFPGGTRVGGTADAMVFDIATPSIPAANGLKALARSYFAENPDLTGDQLNLQVYTEAIHRRVIEPEDKLGAPGASAFSKNVIERNKQIDLGEKKEKWAPAWVERTFDLVPSVHDIEKDPSGMWTFVYKDGKRLTMNQSGVETLHGDFMRKAEKRASLVAAAGVARDKAVKETAANKKQKAKLAKKASSALKDTKLALAVGKKISEGGRLTPSESNAVFRAVAPAVWAELKAIPGLIAESLQEETAEFKRRINIGKAGVKETGLDIISGAARTILNKREDGSDK